MTVTTTGSGTILGNTNPLLIGNREALNMPADFYLSDVRLYDRVVTQAEALAMYLGIG